MSKGQILRALVTQRLAAAAEEIFVLFERTIAEYEEELCRSKEENQRKQQLLDQVLSPRNKQVRGNVQSTSPSPGPSLTKETSETPCVKEESEEQSVKQEEEQLPVPLPESSDFCVKNAASPLLQQTQTELRKEPQGEDLSSEPHFHSESDGHTEHSLHTDNEDWESAFSFSTAQMELGVDGDQYNQVQIRDGSIKLFPHNMSVPETVHSGLVSGAEEADRKKHQCPFCQKRFDTKGKLNIHIRIHTGEKPFTCLVCEKTFAQKCHLDVHTRIHTGERPYSCSICKMHFAQVSDLTKHHRTHTGEKPYSCIICKKAYARKSHLELHSKIHTGEKPYSCAVCQKTFARKGYLNKHLRTHMANKVVLPVV